MRIKTVKERCSVMKKTIQTGGMNKNPAIEKINRLNEITDYASAAEELKKKAFHEEQSMSGALSEAWEQIIDDFNISFKAGGGSS